MTYTIIDCYTDEPSGLGVPPYLGTFPRYLFGALKDQNPTYLTIDDIRLYKNYQSTPQNKEKDMKTNIKIYNLTKNHKNVGQILKNTKNLIIIAGINVPGKYLRAVPADLKEISEYIKELNCKKILTGPAALFGSTTEGGKKSTYNSLKIFNEINYNYLNINNYSKLQPIKGAEILKQIPWEVIAEIETGRGCNVGKCSFCTEPLKSKVQFRKTTQIINEMKALKKQGVQHFRFGKQTCFYSYQNTDLKEIETLLKQANKLNPKTLHIDNVNPNKVITEKGKKITQLIVKYCTPGNVAALGIETFDPEIIKQNFLNTTPKTAQKAIQIINQYGEQRGENGMPKFLPGINLLFGLIGESKSSNNYNFENLKNILDKNMLLRRINIRQVTPYKGTKLYDEAGIKFIKKNKKYYWKWRHKIRQEIDWPMLKLVVPKGTILKDVFMEIYDGKTTFGRQFGTYPLTIGVKGKRLELNKYYNVRVTGHMLRSIIAESIN